MSEPFLGDIRPFGFNFAPRGWAFCDGQILPINQNQALYSLLGTTYGGDGRTTFALPDLRSRSPMHQGDSLQLGQKVGVETVTLTAAELGSHTHQIKGTTAVGDKKAADTDRSFATSNTPVDLPYGDPTEPTNMDPAMVSHTGGGLPHNNMQPYQVVSYCIALQGLFPSRN